MKGIETMGSKRRGVNVNASEIDGSAEALVGQWYLEAEEGADDPIELPAPPARVEWLVVVRRRPAAAPVVASLPESSPLPAEPVAAPLRWRVPRFPPRPRIYEPAMVRSPLARTVEIPRERPGNDAGRLSGGAS